MFSQDYEAKVTFQDGWCTHVKEPFWEKIISYLTGILQVKIKERKNIYSVSSTS